MTPHVAIITPYRNAHIFCRQYVEMLSNQTFSDWHCFLVDDWSTDGSKELLLHLTNNDRRFTHLSVDKPHPPGPYYARNLGLDSSTEEYISFCDIDDIWHPSKLEIQFTHHTKHRLDISVTSYIRMATPSRGHHKHIIPPNQVSYKILLRGNPIPLSTVLISRQFLSGYRFRCIRHEDYLLWLELFRRSPLVRYSSIKITLAIYRIHGNNLTRSRYLMPFWIYTVYYRIERKILPSLYLTLISLISKAYFHIISLFSFKVISLDQFLLSPPA